MSLARCVVAVFVLRSVVLASLVSVIRVIVIIVIEFVVLHVGFACVFHHHFANVDFACVFHQDVVVACFGLS